MVIFIWTADGTPTIGDILTSGTTPFENLISPLRTIRRRIGRYYLIKLLLFDSFSSAVRTTNNNSTGKVVIPLGKFQNKWDL